MSRSLNLTTLRKPLSPTTTPKVANRLIGAEQLRATSKDLYSSPRWQQLRGSVRKLLGDVCCRCGHTGRVVVDHIRSIEQHGMSVAWDPNFLQVLCVACNTAMHVQDKKRNTSMPRDFRLPQQKAALAAFAQSGNYKRILALPDLPAAARPNPLSNWTPSC